MDLVAVWWSVYVEAHTPTFAAAGDDGAVLLSIAETLKGVHANG